MAIDYPPWYTLKSNIVSILEVIAAEETLEDSDRDFTVEQDRYRPWIEADQVKPLVNVMVQGVSPNGASQRTYSTDEVQINVDMYSIGKAGETLPADREAAKRLDLLVAQVREGLTRLDLLDFGFEVGKIDRDQNFTLSYYDQENEQVTGQYAPARWSFNVRFPFYANDKKEYANLEELNVSMSNELADLYSLKFSYDDN